MEKGNPEKEKALAVKKDPHLPAVKVGDAVQEEEAGKTDKDPQIAIRKMINRFQQT